MLRIVFWSLAALALTGTALRAADQPPASENNPHEYHATLVGVDLGKKTITFKTGLTLPLAADAKVLGENNKPETLQAFKDALDKEDAKSILVVADAEGKHVASVRHLPPPETKHRAALVSVDLDKNTVTFKVKGRHGKETETTLSLAKDGKIVGEDNKPETLQQFKEAMDKENDKSIQVEEDANGKEIVALTDLPPEQPKVQAALVSVDLDKNTITFKAKDKDGKEAETTLPLAANARVLGENNKAETLPKFKETLDKEDDKSIFVIEDVEGKQIVSVRDLPPPENKLNAALVSVDVEKNVVTFKARGKDGKETETTLPLAASARVIGEDNKSETLQKFKDRMDEESDKSILVVEDADGKQVVTLTDLPPNPKKYKAVLVSFDLDKNTITFAVETTLPLAKDAKMFGEDAKPETLKQFKAAEDKEKDKPIVIVEDADEKHIVAVTDVPSEKEK